MELHKNADVSCPNDIIAVAINTNEKAPHCGIVFTDESGAVQLCDMQYEHTLAVRSLSEEYFWTSVKLEFNEVLLVSEFVRFVIERSEEHPPPYSFLYTYDGFDATGQLKDGIGLTCATFVVNILERLSLDLLDASTWKRRPIQDAAFQRRIIMYARGHGEHALANRLENEEPRFRVKPWEVCGCASHSRYPVRFRQATKLAKSVSKIVRKQI